MSYQLTYGDYFDLGKMVPRTRFFYFKKHSQMIDFIDQNCIGKKGSYVWLCYKHSIREIFISDNHLSIQDFFEKKSLWNTVDNYWLQEFETLKDAYNEALNIIDVNYDYDKMREANNKIKIDLP